MYLGLKNQTALDLSNRRSLASSHPLQCLLFVLAYQIQQEY